MSDEMPKGVPMETRFIDRIDGEMKVFGRDIRTFRAQVDDFAGRVTKIERNSIGRTALLASIAAAIIGLSVIGWKAFSIEIPALPPPPAIPPQAPVGTIVAWLGADAPDGWAICDNQRIQEGWNAAALKKVLPKVDGNDATRLPDLRGYFLRGFDNRPPAEGPRIDPDERSLGVKQDDMVGKHSHPYHDQNRSDGQAEDDNDGGPYHFVGGNVDPIRNTDENAGLETRPKNIAVHWIIKVR